MHGNTHFPIMVGAAKRFEDTGEGLYKTIVLNFIDVLERTQNFASGGSTFGEHWGSGNLGGIASGVEGWGQDSQVRMCTRPFLPALGLLSLHAPLILDHDRHDRLLFVCAGDLHNL